MKTLLPIFICSLLLAFLSDRASCYGLGPFGEKVYIRREKLLYWIMALVMAVFVGLRTQGNDTGVYLYLYKELEGDWSAVSTIDWLNLAHAPGFTFVNTLMKMAGFPAQLFLMGYALFTVLTYLWFVRKYCFNILFSVFLLFTLSIYGFTMAAIKQTAAMAILLIATDRAIRKQYVAYAVFVLIAELFHPYAFVYLIVPFLDFCPWTGKTYFLLIFTAVGAFGLQYFLEPILIFTEAIGGDYNEASFVGEGVNIFRVLVMWVPGLLSFVARKQIKTDPDRITNIIMNLSMVNAMMMFIALFGTANYFARLANYFLMFQALSLPGILKYYSDRSRKLLTVCAVAGYLGYFYYGNAIANGAFDDTYKFISIGEFLRQLVGMTG